MTEIEKKARLLYPYGIYERNAYIEGATEQIELAKEWLKTNYGHFDGKVEDFVADFEKAMKL